MSIQSNFNNSKEKLLDYLKNHKSDVILKSYKEGGLGLLLGDDEMI